MTKDEALKLALEALESCSAGDYSTGHVIHPSFDVDAVNKAIDAVDEALAQPVATVLPPIVELTTKSEPVYIMGSYVGTGEVASVNLGGVSFTGNSTAGREADVRPTGFFFQMPPQRTWVGLTDIEVGTIFAKWDATQGVSFNDFARAIEARLKEKNT